ncbi:MAG: hypothetical protein NTU49_01290 [Gammaproteobacteria bacterium]|nr:hypothetical protein [Gammaproteobacteria bacterium]
MHKHRSNVYSEQWGEKKRPVGFYDLKADVEALLFGDVVAIAPTSTHFSKNLAIVSASACDSECVAPSKDSATVSGNTRDSECVVSALHPGRSAILYKNNKCIGTIGELHPEILNYFDIRQPVIICELDLTEIKQLKLPHYESFSRFPSVRRDLALVIDESISASRIKALIIEKAGTQLQEVLIFDVYQGKNIELGKKSIALGLTFQDPSRTLIDEEINAIIHDVVTVLERELKATLRV